MKKACLLLVFYICAIGFSQNRNPTDRDPSFNPFIMPLNNYYIDGDIKKMGCQADGKILILASDINSITNKSDFIRLSDNFLDFNFGVGFNHLVEDFVIQPDGKIVVVGRFTTYKGVSKSKIVRLNSDGTIDNTFNIGTGFNNSVANGTPNAVNTIILQPDGKILVAGYFSSYNGKSSSVAMIRLNSNGTLDTNFTCAISNGYAYSVDKMTIQPDGKIVVSQSYPKALVRLNSNGSLDTNFNIGTGANQGDITGIACQSDGKIILIGAFSSFNKINRNGITRLNSDGSNDAEFIGNISGSSLQATDIALQSDGKAFLVGNFSDYGGTSCYTLIRLNLDGTKDSTFDIDKGFPLGGQVYMTYAYTIPKLIVQPDGKILCKINTSAFHGESLNQILRFNLDGSRDYTINNICKGFRGDITAVSEQPDGKIILGGNFDAYNGQTIRSLARLNTDGTVDTAFNANINKLRITASNYAITNIKVLPDGKIIVAGDFGVQSAPYYFLILNADGTRYTGYNVLFDANIRSMAVQSDGKIIVTGDFTTYKNKACSKIIRIFLDGTLDTSFNFSSDFYINKIALQSNNKLIVLGDGGTAPKKFLRLNIDGSNDTTFDSPIIKGSNFIIQPDDKILLTQNTNSTGIPLKVIRTNVDGSIDNTFNYSDSFNTTANNGLALESDGRVLISGFSIAPYTANKGIVKRLNTNGTIDLSYSMPIGFNTESINLFTLSNGKLIATGNFLYYNGLNERSIVRLMGEDYYFLQGQNKLDINNNGCDSADIIFPNLKFQVSNATNTFQYIANGSGSHNIAFSSGNHTITPVFENPSYFSVSPSNITIDFPSKASPSVQDFCIATKGIHPDLEIIIIPVTVARPGFDAKYKIVYKNKGNKVQSGSVLLTFDDMVTDLVSTLPIATTQSTNKLSWDFANLNPFESREIDVVLNLNSPVETPSLNNGNLLNFSASLATAEIDETPKDNEFVFPQTVVGSYDPNDKTCLEGAAISKEKIGDYVHYQIRFENTGTYAAQNIIVRDLIDLSKFDISTLVPEKGSHSFITRIVEGNKVEFVFENINLPFDDANNDGYLTFKIKTVSTLVSGNTFSNSASIYFDYNSAIITNVSTTTIEKVLQNQDFIFENYFRIYPNPVNNNLNIYKNNNIELKSISVYNTLGQVVLLIPNAISLETIDVSNLKSGTYLVRINSNKGISNAKFIKM